MVVHVGGYEYARFGASVVRRPRGTMDDWKHCPAAKVPPEVFVEVSRSPSASTGTHSQASANGTLSVKRL